jgi:hypothetical protein
MAEFNISGRMSVGRLRNQFKEVFGLDLRVYHGQKFAEDSDTLASISDKKVDDFECRGNMLVGNFEDGFLNSTGIKVQVATCSNAKVEPGALVNNKFSLSEAQQKFGV